MDGKHISKIKKNAFLVIGLIIIISISLCVSQTQSTQNQSTQNQNVQSQSIQKENKNLLKSPTEVANLYLSENYNYLPNGSVGNSTIETIQVKILNIDHKNFSLEYLVIGASQSMMLYVNSVADDLCQENAAKQNMTVEECIKQLKEPFSQQIDASILCPIKIEPQQITGPIGPVASCFNIRGNASKENDDLMFRFGEGHNQHYGGSAGDFEAALREAQWNIMPINVTSVTFPISIFERGCYPTSISVYLDEMKNPLTTSQDVMCID